jgi:hypothetical protein
MKRILLSVIMILTLFVNSLSSINNNPVIQISNGYNLEPELQFFEENRSDHMSRFIGVDAIHNGLVTSFLDTLGTTRAFFNLYNSDLNLEHQYILKQSEFSQLNPMLIGEIIGHSNSIWIDNFIITYFQTPNNLDDAFHKLIIIDVENKNSPMFYFIDLEADGINIVNTMSDFSSFKLQFVDGNIFLTSINEADYYSISEINFDISLANNELGYKTGSIKGLINSDSQIIAPTAETELDFCQVFGLEVYCLDLNVDNKTFNYSLYDLELSEVIYTHNNIIVGLISQAGVHTIKVFKIEMVVNVNENIELSAIEKLSFEIDDVNLDFTHINFNESKLNLYSKFNNYKIDLTDFTLTSSYFKKNTNVEIFYNQDGKRLSVEINNGLIYASSDHDLLTYVVNTTGLIVKEFNYYQDKLLFLAYDSGLGRYYYYSYPIAASANQGTPDLVTSFTLDDIRAILNAAYNDGDENSLDYSYADNSKINLVKFKFYKNELYIIDTGRYQDEEFVTNIIHLVPNLPMRAHFFESSPIVAINFDSLQINKDDFVTIMIKAYLTLSPGELDYVAGGSLEFVIGEYNPGVGSGTQFELFGALDDINRFNIDGTYHIYSLELADYKIRYNIYDGAINLSYIKIPELVLENLVNKQIGATYLDFDLNFPYNFIDLYTDENNNLFIKDSINNIYILYNPDLRTSLEVSTIRVNNETILDTSANSFEIIVQNSISSLIIDLSAYFKRILIENSSPFSLNEGSNIFDITLTALDNTIKTITFNVFRAPNIVIPPAIVLPGLDPNYISSSSSSSIISSASSSLSSSSSSIISSTVTPSSTPISSISSSNSINNQVDTNDINQENPLFLWFLFGVPLVLTISLIAVSSYFKIKRKKTKPISVNKPKK